MKSRMVNCCVFMKCQIYRDSARRAIIKFVLQYGRYEPSSPYTKELHGRSIILI